MSMCSQPKGLESRSFARAAPSSFVFSRRSPHHYTDNNRGLPRPNQTGYSDKSLRTTRDVNHRT